MRRFASLHSSPSCGGWPFVLAKKTDRDSRPKRLTETQSVLAGCIEVHSGIQPHSKDELATGIKCRHDESSNHYGCQFGFTPPLDHQSGANIAIFSSSRGGGFYPSYWELDATGEVCSIVINFGVLVESL